jgi:hypothetical protein
VMESGAGEVALPANLMEAMERIAELERELTTRRGQADESLQTSSSLGGSKEVESDGEPLHRGTAS